MITSVGTIFCILMCILLWSIIAGRGYWWIKAIMVPACIWFSIAINVSLPSMLGWPSEAELPYKYELFSAKVVNPSLTNASDGCIFLWVADVDPLDGYGVFELYRYDKSEPRCYKIPYSKEMHKKIQQAQKLLRQGRRVMGENPNGEGKSKGKKGKGKSKGKGEGEGDGQQGQGEGGLGEEGDKNAGPKYYVMPPVDAPEKR